MAKEYLDKEGLMRLVELLEGEMSELKAKIDEVKEAIDNVDHSEYVTITDGKAYVNDYVNDALKSYVPAIVPGEKNCYYFPALSVNDKNELVYWSLKGTPEPSGEKVVIRSKQGRAQMQDPVDPMDIANRRFVEETVANAGVGGGAQLYYHSYDVTIKMFGCDDEGEEFERPVTFNLRFVSVNPKHYARDIHFDDGIIGRTFDFAKMSNLGEINLLSGHQFIDEDTGIHWIVYGIDAWALLESDVMGSFAMYSDDYGFWTFDILDVNLDELVPLQELLQRE